MRNDSNETGEWTAEYVASFIRESYEAPGHTSLQAIADAHNASVKTEREKNEATLNNVRVAAESAQNEVQQLRTKLEELQKETDPERAHMERMIKFAKEKEQK